jgi:hypothetical protein
MPADTKPEVITKHFCSLEKNFETKHQSVLLIGDFSAPNFDWERGLPLSNYSFYSKLNSDAVYTTTCLLDLTRCLATDNSLELVFSNFNRVSAFFADVGVVAPDSCHPSIAIDIPLDLRNSASYH